MSAAKSLKGLGRILILRLTHFRRTLDWKTARVAVKPIQCDSLNLIARRHLPARQRATTQRHHYMLHWIAGSSLRPLSCSPDDYRGNGCSSGLQLYLIDAIMDSCMITNALIAFAVEDGRYCWPLTSSTGFLVHVEHLGLHGASNADSNLLASEDNGIYRTCKHAL